MLSTKLIYCFNTVSVTKQRNLPFASESSMSIRSREKGLGHPTLHACVEIATITVEIRIEKIFISIELGTNLIYLQMHLNFVYC